MAMGSHGQLSDEILEVVDFEDEQPTDWQICQICNRTFSAQFNLIKHLKKYHPDSAGAENAEKENWKKTFFPEKRKLDSTLVCSVCQKGGFKHKDSLSRHMRKVHQMQGIRDVSNSLMMCLEDECDWKGKYKAELVDHLKNVHHMQFLTFRGQFPSVVEFQEWCNSIEEDGKATHLADGIHGMKKLQNPKNAGRVRKWKECSRSGKFYKEGKSSGKRLRGTPSSKIGSKCTFCIQYIMEPDGSVTVEDAVLTHYGHPIELKHTFLNKDDRAQIAHLALMGVSYDKILKKFREDIGLTEFPQQKHLLERKDIQNIVRAHGILTDYQLHNDDAVSVDMWAEKLKVSGHCLFYKPQKVDVPDERRILHFDDFVIIFQTELQRKMLMKFSEKFLCLDSTHHMSRYQFNLYTLLVADEENTGFPVGHMVTNREECQSVVELFCRKIREKMGESPKISYVMTDDKNCLYDGIVSGFQLEECPPQKLLCAWHLRRNLSSNAYKKFPNDPKLAEYYYRRIVECQEKNTVEALQSSFQDLLIDLEETTSEEAKNFAQYLKKQLADRLDQWAYCYRKTAGINVNMFLEAFHRVWKYVYCDKSVGMRLDRTLKKLIDFTNDKAIQRLRKMHFGFKKKDREIMLTHKAAEKADSRNFLGEEDPDSYKIQSFSSGEIYRVSKISGPHCGDTAKCPIRCKECKICVHVFSCTCLSYTFSGGICKHIHFLCMNLNSEPVEADAECREMHLVEASQEVIDCISASDDLPSEAQKAKKGNFDSLEKRALSVMASIKKLREQKPDASDEEVNLLIRLLGQVEQTTAHIQKSPAEDSVRILPEARFGSRKLPERQRPERKLLKTKKKYRPRFHEIQKEAENGLDSETLSETEVADLWEFSKLLFKPSAIKRCKREICELSRMTLEHFRFAANQWHEYDEENSSGKTLLDYRYLTDKAPFSLLVKQEIRLIVLSLVDYYTCFMCKEATTSSDKMVMCDSCTKWFHTRCVEYESNSGEQPWWGSESDGNKGTDLWFCSTYCENNF